MKKVLFLAILILILSRFAGDKQVSFLPATIQTPQVAVPLAPVTPTIAVPLITKPQFQRAVVLGEKVLHSKKELSEYRALLASPVLINEGFQRLLDISEKARGAEAEATRMQTVDFFNAALSWKENPQREAILKAVSALLERSVEDLEAPVDLKRSLAGDSMELYWVLFTHEPTKARDIFDRADGEQQRLYRFATQMAHQTHKGVN